MIDHSVGASVDVYLDTPGLSLDKPFSYFVPSPMDAVVKRGQRVFVPFGHQYKAGLIWAVTNQAVRSDGLKSIVSLIDRNPVLTEEQMSLATWMCDRYACTMNDAISTILPGAFRVRGALQVRVVEDAVVPDDVRATELWRWLIEKKPTLKHVGNTFGKKAKSQVEAWCEVGYLTQQLSIREEVRASYVQWLVGNVERAELEAGATARAKRAPRQAELLNALATHGEIEWKRDDYAKSSVAPLVRDGLVRVVDKPVSRLKWVEPPSGKAPELTEGQARVVAQIRESMAGLAPSSIVLFGVTGSGKTEVYIRSILHTIEQGKQAIVLVPEISLTPQMVGRFYARFGEQIAVLHSGLSMGERRDEWERILRGDAAIVIGARSAVFAPVANLGLLIVDEEHEPSYKQEETPHYDTRDVALERVSQMGAVTLFGSATPSLEAIRLVELGDARMLTLPTRVTGRSLPTVEIVDMRDELKSGNHTLFSQRLSEEIEETIALDQQVILFLNRRGFASSMLCRACGENIRCPRCDISLTLHKGTHQTYLSCHYCGFQQAEEHHCPACGERALRAFGIGTEQIEEAVRKLWPSLRVLRMDVDTTRRKGALQQIVDTFEAREADVLIGTQMIAKGLDFPHVRLVGVITADTMLSVPDYRANERTFQLLTQVAGRAGRAKTEGRTIIQTYRPDHFAITSASHHDFQTFYREERAQRESFRYPPFCEMAVFLATHESEVLARGAASRFERELKRAKLPEDTVVLPASPCSIRRIEDKFRYQVVLKYQSWENVRDWVTEAYQMVKLKMNAHGGTCRLDVSAKRIG